MTEKFGGILDQLRKLRVNIEGGVKSPHKYLFLLALVELYNKDSSRTNAFSINSSDVDVAFKEVCRESIPACYLADFNIELPFVHLASDGMWILKIKSGKERQFRDYKDRKDGQRLTFNRVIETVEYGSLSDEWDECFRDSHGRNLVVSELKSILAEISRQYDSSSRMPSRSFARIETAEISALISADGIKKIPTAESSTKEQSFTNPFIGYLNSLQRLGACNENALAESQACNPFFTHIQVSHPLTQVIFDELRNPAGRNIILTGHAGDGKSTIALEVYKLLRGIPGDQPLAQPMRPREDLYGTNITIVKDLSERKKEEDVVLVKELLGNQRRFFLVTNTGTILDLLRMHAAEFNLSEVKIESDVLVAIGNEQGEADLRIGGSSYLVANLARMDNLDLSRRIFERMIATERWAPCYDRTCSDSCPILKNVELINSSRDIVLERLFLAYRRMYEYGTRLTMRQITEHLAYLITSGLEESDIAALRSRRPTPLQAEFMFFNRFFGDNGMTDDTPALQIQAIQDIRRQGFGERPCPIWERKLWLKLRDRNFRLGVEHCDEEFNLLREHGSGPGDDNRPGLTPDQAREQVRRMLFFLYDFSPEEPSFLTQFLNSQTILRWLEWQKPGARLEMTEKSSIEHRIYHVLQEHFTGVRLPERATGQDRRLYITLSRRRNEIRQSAQVVLAQIDWSNELVLDLVLRQNSIGNARTDLELNGRGRLNGASLVLTLPFLDYVVMRHYGELGEILQAAYVERLERFKTQIQKLAKETRSNVMLVRLKTDHTFRRQQYAVSDNKVEVIDVL